MTDVFHFDCDAVGLDMYTACQMGVFGRSFCTGKLANGMRVRGPPHLRFKGFCKSDTGAMGMDIERREDMTTIVHTGDTIYTEDRSEEGRNEGLPSEKSVLNGKKPSRQHQEC